MLRLDTPGILPGRGQIHIKLTGRSPSSPTTPAHPALPLPPVSPSPPPAAPSAGSHVPTPSETMSMAVEMERRRGAARRVPAPLPAAAVLGCSAVLWSMPVRSSNRVPGTEYRVAHSPGIHDNQGNGWVSLPFSHGVLNPHIPHEHTCWSWHLHHLQLLQCSCSPSVLISPTRLDSTLISAS